MTFGVSRPAIARYASGTSSRLMMRSSLARLDSALQHVGQQFLDVGAHRRGTAADRHVGEERGLRVGHRLPLRDADPAGRAARARDLDRCGLRLLKRPTHSSTAWNSLTARYPRTPCTAFSPRSATTSVASS